MALKNDLIIHELDTKNKGHLKKIADWYHQEWNTPKDVTIERLSHLPNPMVLFQLVVINNSQLIASSGLCQQVNLTNVYPEFERIGPWIGLFFVDQTYRNQGVGKALLSEMELKSKGMGLDKIYLYTYTAESFYKKNGWKSIKTIKYKNCDTAIMAKDFNDKTFKHDD